MNEGIRIFEKEITTRDNKYPAFKAGDTISVLCEYEKGREWEKFLDSILIELLGFDVEERTINYYCLVHKVSSLRYLRYEYFRSTIFDCMSLLSKQTEVKNGIL